MSTPLDGDEPSRLLKTAATTLDVLDALKETGGTTAAELAERLDLSETTTYNQLTTLREHEFVVKDGTEYRLSGKHLLFGEQVRQGNALYQHGREELEEIAAQTGEYAQLVIEQFGRGIIVYETRGDDAIGEAFQARLQQEAFDLHYTAAGKAILAHLPDARVGEIIADHGLTGRTAQTITDRDRLREELAEIRERGYAFNDEEQVEGLRVVGAPIRGPEGEVLGALSVSGPTSRMQDERYHEELPRLVTKTANLIEVNINMARRSEPA
ncbi:IclR family transcriptional regulator [Haloplanus pelagicus]|jgi:DNA-binding IclR family transcriptional regulator|uniref:IclR family transcriptional regulator n=1 Tax=Haloplanus pelagicus TaxID=2949995 RepID=UPI00203F072A|nr:IclR family transcriptional regulator [Haloplanus sp. HW8-1]